MPEHLAEREAEVRDNLVEGIVVSDDAMLESYLEGTNPSVDDLERTMATGVASAKVYPVVCGSAIGPIAVDRLADFIVELGPSPLDAPLQKSWREIKRSRWRKIPKQTRLPSSSRLLPIRMSVRYRCSRCCPGPSNQKRS